MGESEAQGHPVLHTEFKASGGGGVGERRGREGQLVKVSGKELPSYLFLSSRVKQFILSQV